MGDSPRSVTSICGPSEYITPIGVRVPHNPLSVAIYFGVAAYSAATTLARIGAASAQEIP